MSQSKTSLLTPIYIKPRADTAWPEDSVFYMLTGSGLFLCRNNPFYQSAVPAPRWPGSVPSGSIVLAMSATETCITTSSRSRAAPARITRTSATRSRPVCMKSPTTLAGRSVRNTAWGG